MIPESFIQELLNRVDIVDVVDKSVPLKKAGANYSACCPFHNEKSPSFTVSPTKQFYHCFGCGAHGTAISFLMEYNGLSFVEAIHDLAKNVGMIVPQEQSTPEWQLTGGDTHQENVAIRPSLAERAERYQERTIRLSMCEYPNPKYIWIIEALTVLREQYKVDSNAEAILHAVAQATGTEIPK